MQKLLSIIFICCTLVGCGYTFQGSTSILPPDIKKIYIPTVENNTTEGVLSNYLTESLRDRFEQFGVVSVVDSYAEADAVLNVKTLRLKRASSNTTSRTDSTLQQTSVLTLFAELKRVDGQVLWKNPSFVVSGNYGTTAGSISTSSAQFAAGGLRSSDLASLDSRELARGQEQETLQVMSDDAAKKIYDEAVAPDF